MPRNVGLKIGSFYWKFGGLTRNVVRGDRKNKSVSHRFLISSSSPPFSTQRPKRPRAKDRRPLCAVHFCSWTCSRPRTRPERFRVFDDGPCGRNCDRSYTDVGGGRAPTASRAHSSRPQRPRHLPRRRPHYRGHPLCFYAKTLKFTSPQPPCWRLQPLLPRIDARTFRAPTPQRPRRAGWAGVLLDDCKTARIPSQGYRPAPSPSAFNLIRDFRTRLPKSVIAKCPP